MPSPSLKSRRSISYRGQTITRVESLNKRVFWYTGDETLTHYRLKDAKAHIDASLAPRYTSPSDDAIAAYAATYRELGPSCGHHTRMSYAVMPTREDFDRAFDAVTDDDGLFSFGNDPYVGTDNLRASELWRELATQHAKWEEGEHGSHCKGDGSCNGEGCPSEDAGSWCSSVLGVLGFEWV